MLEVRLPRRFGTTSRGSVCSAWELQRWQAEARRQQESSGGGGVGLRAELQETRAGCSRCRATMKHLRSLTWSRPRDIHRQQRRRWVGGSERGLCCRRLRAEQRTQRPGCSPDPVPGAVQGQDQACLTKTPSRTALYRPGRGPEGSQGSGGGAGRACAASVCPGVGVAAGELKAHSAQLESGDDALSALSQHLRDTQRDLESSRKHSQECEMVISTMRDSTAALRQQVEEQEESVVKSQADFSVYRATHIRSDSDYDTQLCPHPGTTTGTVGAEHVTSSCWSPANTTSHCGQ
nr:uncharacterized protein LOC111969115 [Salvelinus alpinus]